MIRWLVLDASGVLFTRQNSARLHALARHCPPTISPHQIHHRIWASGLDALFENGYYTASEAHAALVEAIGYRGDLAQLQTDWCTGLELNDDVVAFASNLAPALGCAVLSDDGPLVNIPDRYPAAARLANPIVISCDIGVRKPAAAAFDAVLARMGRPEPDTVLYVDTEAANCVAAQRLGLHAHRFASLAGLRAELDRHQVLTADDDAWARVAVG